MADQELDLRKKIILKAIVDDYVSTAEPVGSRTIAKKYDMGLSPATIRNEMADLEDMGYLIQPHTSSGRVPSDKGYRTYVNELLNTDIKTVTNLVSMQSYLEKKIDEFRELIHVASEMLSEITKYTAVSVVSAVDELRVKAIQLAPLEKSRVLVVVVMSNDAIQNKMVTVDGGLKPDDVLRLSNVLNDNFVGLSVSKVKSIDINSLVYLIGSENLSILPIIDGVFDCMNKCADSEVHHEGEANMFMHPEFGDIDKAKNMLQVLHSDDKLKELFANANPDGGYLIKIGSENFTEDMNDCAIISATYNINDTCVGTIGVIGPKRMNYAKVISALEYIKNKINSHTEETGNG